MRRMFVLLFAVTLLDLATLGLTRALPVAGQDSATPAPNPDTQAKIDSAMSAAPSSVSAGATILDWEMDEAGTFLVLRAGGNGWFCQPDLPSTPGNDPQCLDQTWLDWQYAFVAGETPTVATAGFAYMLQGGTDPSNTDPLATEPPAGEEWVASPPHVMILLPGKLDLTAYSTDHHSGQPYVMWAGTPYQHIMMPVADLAPDA